MRLPDGPCDKILRYFYFEVIFLSQRNGGMRLPDDSCDKIWRYFYFEAIFLSQPNGGMQLPDGLCDNWSIDKIKGAPKDASEKVFYEKILITWWCDFLLGVIDSYYVHYVGISTKMFPANV